MKVRNKLSVEYREGVPQFLEIVKFHVDAYERIRCPCNRCMHSNWYSLEGVEWHLLTIRISPFYTEWMYHGDPVNFHRGLEFILVTLCNSLCIPLLYRKKPRLTLSGSNYLKIYLSYYNISLYIKLILKVKLNISNYNQYK